MNNNRIKKSITCLLDKSVFKNKITCVILLAVTVIMLVSTGCSDSAEVIDELGSTGMPDSMTDYGPAFSDESIVSDDYSDADGWYVYVCGAVVNPGVVCVPEGSRADYAIELAGGFAEGANTVYINLAARVYDGQRLFVPYLTDELNEEFVMDSSEIDAGISDTTEAGYPVNINAADASMLCTLPGIGVSKANSIIEFRNSNGPFKHIEDIMEVSGIGETSFRKLEPYICVY